MVSSHERGNTRALQIRERSSNDHRNDDQRGHKKCVDNRAVEQWEDIIQEDDGGEDAV